MLMPQVEPITRMARDHKSVLRKLQTGPVFLAQHSQISAVVLSPADYENLLANAEEAQQLRRWYRADLASQAMDAGHFSEVSPEELASWGA